MATWDFTGRFVECHRNDVSPLAKARLPKRFAYFLTSYLYTHIIYHYTYRNLKTIAHTHKFVINITNLNIQDKNIHIYILHVYIILHTLIYLIQILIQILSGQAAHGPWWWFSPHLAPKSAPGTCWLISETTTPAPLKNIALLYCWICSFRPVYDIYIYGYGVLGVFTIRVRKY